MLIWCARGTLDECFYWEHASDGQMVKKLKVKAYKSRKDAAAYNLECAAALIRNYLNA